MLNPGEVDWKLAQLLHADDALLLGESQEELHGTVPKVNVSKSTTLFFERDGLT